MPAYPEPSDIFVDDRWFGSRTIWKDRPILVRGRSGLASVAGHPKYGRKLTIAWEYGDNGASGMPTPEANDDLQSFEERATRALEQDNHTLLVAVVTCRGSREWIWYTQDAKEAARRVNQMLAGEPGRPLRLKVVDDPEWLEYLGIVQNYSTHDQQL